jgi:hypothetical protein
MPIIPTYESQLVPTRRAPQRITPRVETGAAITRLGGTVLDIGLKFKRAEDVSQYNESLKSLRGDLMSLRFSFSERSDFGSFQEDFRKEAALIVKNRSEAMKNNSLWGSFESQMDGAIASTEVAVRTMKRRKQVDFGRASYTTTMEQMAEEYGSATDVEKRSLIVQAEDITQLNADVGYITQQEAQKAIKNFGYNAMKSDAWESARIMDFEEGISWLQNEGNVPKLAKEDRNNMIAQLRRDWAAQIREQEKLETSLEEEHKKQIAENDFVAWQEFHTGNLTMSELNSLASLRRISLKTYNAIVGKYKEEIPENDANVVGELSESLELGVDIEEDLTTALGQGEITAASYINLKRAMGVKDHKRGLYYINNSLKPTQFEAWNPDKFRRHADAVEEYNERVAEKFVSFRYEEVFRWTT